VQCIPKKLDTVITGYNAGYSETTTLDTVKLQRWIQRQNHDSNMNKKERDRINELKYRKTRIDRHDTTVCKFLDDAIENKKSVTRVIHELIDHEAHLEAQLRRNEADKLDEALKICSVIFKNMLPDYRAGQLYLWFAAFKKRFVERVPDFDIKKYIDAIEETERERAEIHLKNAIPIKGKG